MKSSLPKVLHPIAHKPMIYHVLDTATHVGAERVIVVVPGKSELVKKAVIDHLEGSADVFFAEQKEQKGTAHAVAAALPHLKDFQGNVVVLYADTPFISSESIERLIAPLGEARCISVQGFHTDDPTGYGRLVTSDDATLDAIVEHIDTTDEQRKITLCNAGVMGFVSDRLQALIPKIDNKNKKGEYYLTDAVELANKEKSASVAYTVVNETEVLGINTRQELAHAEYVFQHMMRDHMMANGVTLLDPETTYFSADTDIDSDVTIHPNVYFGPGVTVASNSTIKSFTHLEGAVIQQGATVGPFARIRPGSDIGENVRIGNFVEVKNSKLGTGTKANHLAYLGDAEIGEATNIGAGTITCNYDGTAKHKTHIGDSVSVGANCSLIAPISIGDGSIVGAGSVIDKPVNNDALAIARSPQENFEGKAPAIKNRKN